MRAGRDELLLLYRRASEQLHQLQAAPPPSAAKESEAARLQGVVDKMARSYGLVVRGDAYYNDSQSMAVYCLAKPFPDGSLPFTALSNFEEYKAAMMAQIPQCKSRIPKRKLGEKAETTGLLSSRRKRVRRAPTRLVEQPELMGFKSSVQRWRFAKGDHVVAQERPGESAWPGVVAGYKQQGVYMVKWRGYKNYITEVPERRVRERPVQCPFPNDENYVRAWCNKIIKQ